MVGITWGQLLALLFLATLPWIFFGFYLGRLTRTTKDGAERLVFQLPPHVEPRAPSGPPQRRWSDLHPEGWQ